MNDTQHGPGTWIVSWGMGGAKHTRAGLTRAEAGTLMNDVRAWGPVLITRDADGIPRWADSGQPLPEGNRTRDYLMSVIPQGKPGTWRPDGGIEPGGDVGGDLQAGDSWSVRYRRAGRPFAMITRTAYPAHDDQRPGQFFVQVETEWLTCAEPLDPDRTETWCDYAYDDEPGLYASLAQAEKAARQVAARLLRHGGSHHWDGTPGTHRGGGAS